MYGNHALYNQVSMIWLSPASAMFPAFLLSSSHFYQSTEGSVATHITITPEGFRLRPRDAELLSRHFLTAPARLAPVT